MSLMSQILLLCRLTLLLTLGQSNSVINQRLSLKREEVIAFNAKPLALKGLYNPHFWYENNERSTSANYSLWAAADVQLVEWPGNVTIPDPKFPLVKWSKARAKFIINRCAESYAGIELRAYAYDYLYLTWGPYRLMATYSPPLTFPASLFLEKGTPQEFLATDFSFVYDALLIVLENENSGSNSLLRIHGLEMAYAKIGEKPLNPLKYQLAKGISSPINRILTQYCCKCPNSENVVAYREYFNDFRIYISEDSGQNFRLLTPLFGPESNFLHGVLSFPDEGALLIVHGTKNYAALTTISISSGVLKRNRTDQIQRPKFKVFGTLQVERIGEEHSILVWDQCNVWYSSDMGKNFTSASFYVHGFIRHKKRDLRKHYFMGKFCKLGLNSTLAYSSSGNLGLLDSENNFHLGLDDKFYKSMANSSLPFALVPMKFDLSLLEEQLAVVPSFEFDRSQHPQLLYPPRYLSLPPEILSSSQFANYSRRLGMRLLPKSVHPSEFISAFQPQNVLPGLNKKLGNFLLQPCQTSSLSVNHSLSQKPKYYTLSHSSPLNFTIRFKSRSNSSFQLNYSPESSYVSKFLHVQMILEQLEEEDEEEYWFNYRVIIKPRALGEKSRKYFKLNFHTLASLRCLIQPRSSVYVTINKNAPVSDFNEEERARKPSFVKMGEETEYGKSFTVELGSGSCSSCQRRKESGKLKKAHKIAHPTITHMHSEL